jgi:hypothetical protein
LTTIGVAEATGEGDADDWGVAEQLTSSRPAITANVFKAPTS